MGNSSSKPAAAPSLLLDEQWRQINWGDRQTDLQFVKTYRPQAEGRRLRILLHGPIGAGKSSFINSVYSVLQGRMCIRARVANGQDSATRKFTTYDFPAQTPNTFYSFVLNDFMGLKHDSRRNRRVHVKDVKRALKGHIRDNYVFNSEYKLVKESEFYNDAPTANDKVHILVYVIDANTGSLTSTEALETLKDISEEAADLDIPQVAIFSKIDKACPEVAKDVKNVYRSRLLQRKIEEFSATLGIPINCVFPVKNYHSEGHLHNDTDALILSTLRRIIEIGSDFLDNQ